MDEQYSNRKRCGSPEHGEEETNCQFVIKHKKRKCKALKRIGQYCTEHSYLLSDTDFVRKRIPCPLDPHHSVYEDALERHVKFKCNKRAALRPDCYKGNVNSGDSDGEDSASYTVTIRTVAHSEVLEVIETVQRLYSEHVGKIKKEVLFHEVLREEFESPKNGAVAHKHILQQASLIGHMEALGFLADHHCYVEFGSGRGGLSHWIQRSVAECTDTQFVLVDKSSFRYKKDSYHRGADQGPRFERLKIDIEHFDIERVPNLENDRKVIAVGKHLCGAATDLMLRCLTRLSPNSKHAREMVGVTLALCCHHRCDWRSYVGKAFIRQCGLTARQFSLLCSLSSWGTCNSAHVDTDDAEAVASYTHPMSGNRLPQEREIIGNQCKHLIDLGRAKYLKAFGFKSDILEFIDKKYTLENVCLLAHRQPKSGQSTPTVSDTLSRT